MPKDNHYLGLLKAQPDNMFEILESISDEDLTEAVCVAAININIIAVKLIPEKKRTEAVYLAMLKQGATLDLIPEDKQTQNICIAAVEQSVSTFEQLKESQQTPKVCLAMIKKYGYALEYIPIEKRTKELCHTAVKHNGLALAWVPAGKRTKEICLAAVKENGKAISFVPEKEQTAEIFLAAVTNHWLALELIIMNMQESLKKLTDEQKTELYLAAIKQKALVLKIMPDLPKTPEFYHAAVSENWSALEYVPHEKLLPQDYLDICYAAIKQNGFALNLIPRDKRVPKICLAATTMNPSALQYVPGRHKKLIIDTVTPTTLLAADYSLNKYFPKTEEYENEIKQFLSKIENVIISKKNPDNETIDGLLVYSNAKKRHGKTVAISIQDPVEVDHLFKKIQQYNKKDSIQLALLGHANEEAEELGGMHVKNILEICEQYPAINHIQLLGCHTGKSSITENEINMNQLLKEKMENKEKKKYVLQTAIDAPVNSVELQNQCIAYCNKKNLNGAYILSKDSNNQYRLIIMKLDADNNITEKIKNIPNHKINELNEKFGIKANSFPRSDKVKSLILRESITLDELQALRDATYEQDRFDKRHPKYKADKGSHVFLARMLSKPEELKNSLLKKLTEELTNDPDINRDIRIDAFPKQLLIDTKNQRFESSKTYLYPSSNYNKPLFFSDEHSIVHKKLKTERESDIKNIKKGKTQDESNAKKITVEIGKKNS